MSGNHRIRGSSAPAGETAAVSLQDLRPLFITAEAVLPDVAVRGITADAARVSPGTLYVALDTGHPETIGDAVRNGAVAVVVEQFPPRDPGVPVLLVQDARRVLGHLLDRVHGHPSQAMAVAAVTGSLGRADAARLLVHALGQGGIPAGRVSAAAGAGAGAEAVHRRVRACRAAGLSTCAFVASPRDLARGHAEGLRLRSALFTDFVPSAHRGPGGPAAALEAILDLFRGLAGEAHAVVNRDDDLAEAVLEESGAPVLTYGVERGGDVRARIRRLDRNGAELEVRSPFGTVRIRTPMMGRRQISALVGSYAMALALGADAGAAAAGLDGAAALPCRLERLRLPLPFTVALDRAATGADVAGVLDAARPLCERRLWLVFGVRGGRSMGSRRRLAEAIETGADQVVVTTDRTGSGHPMAVVADLLREFRAPREVLLEPDRTAAIRLALGRARPGDFVLVAGARPGDRETIRDFFLRSVAPEAAE